jgi:DnaJ-domain-containing protein 1
VPNPFETLGLPARFELASTTIERAYLSRIAALHPDLADAGGETGDQDRLAAALNDAKATLLDDEQRAESLLAVLGGPGKGEDKSLPPGFLMGMMEIRESVEADLLADAAGARTRWRAWANERASEHRAALGERFRAPIVPLKEIRTILNQWRYLARLLEQLDATSERDGTP